MKTIYTSPFYINACKAMQGFLRSMNISSLNNIVHDITFGEGQVSILTPDLELIKFYNRKKIPLAYTDNSGRFLQEGIYLNKVVESQHPKHARLVQKFLQFACENNLNYGENYIHYVIREFDCQHMYTLFFNLPYHDFLHLIVNNGSLIKDAIEKYHHKAQNLILEAKAFENRIILPNMVDLIASNKKSIMSRNLNCVFLLHRNTRLPIHLSPQRSLCLMHLMQGKSVKEIACAMNLSAKTIEHYLEFLRKELGCRSSKELLAFYGEQLNS